MKKVFIVFCAVGVIFAQAKACDDVKEISERAIDHFGGIYDFERSDLDLGMQELLSKNSIHSIYLVGVMRRSTPRPFFRIYALVNNADCRVLQVSRIQSEVERSF